MDKVSFEKLIEWGRESREFLKSLYSSENVAILKKHIALLGNEEDNQVNITSENFPDFIYKMFGCYKNGSKDLGNTILSASDDVKSGDVDSAKQKFESFIRNSPSKFYREIAKVHLEKIDTNSNLGASELVDFNDLSWSSLNNLLLKIHQQLDSAAVLIADMHFAEEKNLRSIGEAISHISDIRTRIYECRPDLDSKKGLGPSEGNK